MAKLFILLGSLFVSTMSLALPNPSWVYCIEKGGSYETRVDSQGNQDGVCMFNEDGVMSECGGWAYFRNDCAPGECKLWSVDMNECMVTLDG